MGAPYVLSERDYLTLKRDHQTLQRELSNLKRSIARGPVRKHQGRFIPPGRFYKTLATLAHAGSCLAKRITRNAGDTAWVLSTEDSETVYDIQLNTGETLDSATVVYCVPYEGKWVVLTMYCTAADWI